MARKSSEIHKKKEVPFRWGKKYTTNSLLCGVLLFVKKDRVMTTRKGINIFYYLNYNNIFMCLIERANRAPSDWLVPENNGQWKTNVTIKACHSIPGNNTKYFLLFILKYIFSYVFIFRS